MVAAGIVESSVDVRARDQAQREQYTRENKYGLELVDIGRLGLLAGVWGVNGLRNRILVSVLCLRPYSVANNSLALPLIFIYEHACYYPQRSESP